MILLWIWLAGSALTLFPMWRRIAWAFAKSWDQDYVDGMDVGMGLICALFAAAAWFVVVPGWYGFHAVGGGEGISAGMNRIFADPDRDKIL